MTIHHHPLRDADKAAMQTMRAMIALQPPLPLSPQGRAIFDEIIAHTPHAEGIQYEAASVGSVPGWWCRPPGALAQGAMLYLHGGGYVIGSAQAYRAYVGQVARRAGLQAFVADYALAPERPYPAATTEAMAAYRGLVTQGHRHIVLAGDSAGGGLALSLLASLRDEADLPQPVGAVVFSPWTDLALTGTSMESRASADPLLSRQALQDAATLYLGEHSRCLPLVSPLYGELGGLPPVLIHVGEDEVLLDDSLRYAARLQAAGGSVAAHVWAGMPHVFSANSGVLQAAEEALESIHGFVAGVMPWLPA
ncbi:alpha/beta hydrolase [Novosphingobium terrae]|uniref:alpha/beta hydrolase n=1 Tax=Novosphingobium terrae TaxID=2726189 RepID=UPI001980C73E|nr:alpha/beta hydrolase [Novosphingobium terrae]